MKDFLVKVREWEDKTKSTNVASRLIEYMSLKQLPGIEGECWEWDKHGLVHGYAAITVFSHWGDRKSYRVHRLALSISTGVEPDQDIYACHICDNRPCFNPAHLYWGDASKNAGDYARRGRSKHLHARQTDLSIQRTQWFNRYSKSIIEKEFKKNPYLP